MKWLKELIKSMKKPLKKKKVRISPPGDCARCADTPDTECEFYGEPDGCNNRPLARIVRKATERTNNETD